MADPQAVVAVLVGDAHLSERSFVGRSDMLGDPQYALSQVRDHVCQLAKTEPLQYVIAAGDLFDSKKPTSEVSLFFRRFVADLRSCNVKFAHIRGNHDYCSISWPQAISASAVHIDGKLLELATDKRSLTIYGMDYTPVDQLAEAIAKIPKADILICHQRWDEFAGGSGDGSLTSILPGKVKTVFTGDTHLSKQFKLGGMLIVSPGATHMRKSDEPARHYVYNLLADGTIDPVALKSRPVVRRCITCQTELEGFLDNAAELLCPAEAVELPEQLRRPIVVIRLEYLLQKAKRRIEKVCKGKAHLFWSTSREQQGQEVELDVVPGTTDFLTAVNEETGDRNTQALISRLWSAENLRQEFEQIKKERGLCD